MKYTPLVQKAYDIIEHKIVTGVLSPGISITEKYLCELTNIGRMPVHEACIYLEKSHLLKIIPRKRMIISPIVWDEISQQLELRRVIEPLLMKHAAINAQPEERQEFLRLKNVFEEASQRGDIESTVLIDGEFNQFVIEVSRNNFIREAISPLWALARRMYYLNYHADTLIGKKIDNAHCELMEALAYFDLPLVEQKSLEIIDCVEFLYKKALNH